MFKEKQIMQMLTLKEIREKLGKYVAKSEDTIDYTTRWVVEQYAIEHFGGKLPYMNSLSDTVYEGELTVGDPRNMAHEDIPVYDDDCSDEELREKNSKIDVTGTLENILVKYPDTIVYRIRAGKLKDSILFNRDFIYYNGVFYMDVPELPKDIRECLVEKEETPRIRWILRSAQGRIITKYMDITPKGDIESNYNDDFPPIHEKITELIHSDESSIMILHGKPGTGKTSYIRNLIASNEEVNFYWIDSSMFAYIDTSEFIEFLSSCKNAVFILEDSESLLVSREESKNPAMQSLLSISDGMLGDSLKLKFICTFNTQTTNIDEAILRKGRCRIRYEFMPLNKEKVKQIFRKLGLDESTVTEDTRLCDVYNYLEDNGVKVKKNKIGF